LQRAALPPCRPAVRLICPATAGKPPFWYLVESLGGVGVLLSGVPQDEYTSVLQRVPNARVLHRLVFLKKSTRRYTAVHVGTRRYTSVHGGTRRYTAVHVGTRRYTAVLHPLHPMCTQTYSIACVPTCTYVYLRKRTLAEEEATEHLRNGARDVAHAGKRVHLDLLVGGDEDKSRAVLADGEVRDTEALHDGLGLAALHVPGDELLVIRTRHKAPLRVQPAQAAHVRHVSPRTARRAHVRQSLCGRRQQITCAFRPSSATPRKRATRAGV